MVLQHRLAAHDGVLGVVGLPLLLVAGRAGERRDADGDVAEKRKHCYASLADWEGEVGSDNQSPRRSDGWQFPFLCMLGGVLIGITFLVVRDGQRSICSEGETTASCAREWLAVFAPWLAIIIAANAIGPVIKQWSEMRRQNEQNFLILLQSKKGEYEIFKSDVISTIRAFEEIRTFLVGQPVEPSNYERPAFDALRAIGSSTAAIGAAQRARLALFSAKIIGSQHAEHEDISFLYKSSVLFSLVDTALYGSHNQSYVEQELNERATDLQCGLNTWMDLINLLNLAIERGGRVSQGINRDILDLRNRIDTSLDELGRQS